MGEEESNFHRALIKSQQSSKKKICIDNVEERAFCFITKENFIRKKLIRIVGWRWFERTVIIMIVINCIMLALYDPLDKDCTSDRCQVLDILEYIIFCFFAMEMLMKITAKGAFGKHGYFNDRWNLFDFSIVITGVVDLLGIGSGGFLTIVRLGRIFRPLRAINRVPSIRILVSLLMDTIPMLGNVLILAFLVFSLFGILGVQLFQGRLRSRCYLNEEGLNEKRMKNETEFQEFFLQGTSVDFVCSLPNTQGTRSCEDIPKEYDYDLCQRYYKAYHLSGNHTEESCLDASQYYRVCRKDGGNPYYGSVSFDNITMAFIFIYQVVTLEGWSDLMYLIQDAYSVWAWIYFVVLISIGSFFLVNLALVVITMQFSDTKRREVRLIKQNKQNASSQLSLYSDLCSVWVWIISHMQCLRRYFGHVHHIHQHVLVQQQTSPPVCSKCRKVNPFADAASERQINAHPTGSFIIPDIEISHFVDAAISDATALVGKELFPLVDCDKTKTRPVQRSASYPGLHPKSLDYFLCSSYGCSHDNIARKGINNSDNLTYVNHHVSQKELRNSTNDNICSNVTTNNENADGQHSSISTKSNVSEDYISSNQAIINISNIDQPSGSKVTEMKKKDCAATGRFYKNELINKATCPNDSHQNIWLNSPQRIKEENHVNDTNVVINDMKIENGKHSKKKAFSRIKNKKAFDSRHNSASSESDNSGIYSPTLNIKIIPRLQQYFSVGTMNRNNMNTSLDSNNNNIFNDFQNSENGSTTRDNKTSVNVQKKNKAHQQGYNGDQNISTKTKKDDQYNQNCGRKLNNFSNDCVQQQTNTSNTQDCTGNGNKNFNYLSVIDPPHLLLPTLANSRSSLRSASNTISLHADTSVMVKGCHSPSISSRTSLSLKINGDSFATSTCVAFDPEEKLRTTSHSNCSSRVSTIDSTEYTSSDLGYGSVFDLRHCDKYYVSHIPTRLEKFKLFCKHISESSATSNIIMVIIMLNTICMAVEHHNEPEKMTNILETLNVLFIWVFTIEMCVKIFGIGFRSYFSLGFNCFDFIVVFLSIIELLIDGGKSSGNFTVFRSLRLLRIFRLIRPMRHQIAVMLRTTSSVMTFFALLFLFMFTFAILGMNIFGGKFKFHIQGKEIQSRSNFDSFLWAIVTVFQILTQEDWNLVMYDGIRATTLWASLYFLFLMTIGYYVLFNLLVAILVEGFTTPFEKKRMVQHLVSMIQNKSLKKNSSVKRVLSLPEVLNEQGNDTATKQLNIPSRRDMRRSTLGAVSMSRELQSNLLHISKNNSKSGYDSDSSTESQISFLVNSPVHRSHRSRPHKAHPILLSARKIYGSVHNNERELNPKKRAIKKSFINPDYTSFELGDDDCDAMNVNCTRNRKDWSLYLFARDNCIRKAMIRIRGLKWFDIVILILIIYSCVLLALENPHKQMSKELRMVIDISMFAMTWVFFCEMMVKVIADGFISGENTYLRNGWNILDFLLVITSLVDVFVVLYYSGTNFKQTDIIKGVRVFRATRALRPLRMIRRAPGLKLVVQTLLYSLKPIGNTVLIAAIFFVVFGILGVQQLKGKFYFCHGLGVTPYTVENRTECENLPKGKWVNYQYNFDNLLEALMALFVVSTKDGWVDIMRRGIDARGVDLEPRVNYAEWRILYFVSFLLIGGFLVLNMIVGVVVENFQKCQELQDKRYRTKAVLNKWKDHVKETKHHRWIQYSPWRRKIYRICNHQYWSISITCIICANIVVMSLEHYQMSKLFELMLELSNIVFTVVYIIEAILLLIALSPRIYFQNRWHCFDMAIVVISVVCIFLERLPLYTTNPAVIKGLRVLRVVRALKILKMAKGLRFLLDHVAETIPQVTNLALLFCLLFFVYSCLGIQLFGTLECSLRYPCAGLGRHANFKSLGSSMLTLFRIATGDNWSGILKDTLRSNCDNSIDCKRNCCVSRYVSPIFFVSFVLFAQFVLVNIVIAVLMKHLRVDKNRRRKKRQSNEKEKKHRDLDAKKALSKWRSNIHPKIEKKECRNGKQRQTSISSQSTVKTSEKVSVKRKHSFLRNQNKNNHRNNNNKNCNFHANEVCFQARNRLLRKYSCPEKFKFQSEIMNKTSVRIEDDNRSRKSNVCYLQHSNNSNIVSDYQKNAGNDNKTTSMRNYYFNNNHNPFNNDIIANNNNRSTNQKINSSNTTNNSFNADNKKDNNKNTTLKYDANKKQLDGANGMKSKQKNTSPQQENLIFFKIKKKFSFLNFNDKSKGSNDTEDFPELLSPTLIHPNAFNYETSPLSRDRKISPQSPTIILTTPSHENLNEQFDFSPISSPTINAPKEQFEFSLLNNLSLQPPNETSNERLDLSIEKQAANVIETTKWRKSFKNDRRVLQLKKDEVCESPHSSKCQLDTEDFSNDIESVIKDKTVDKEIDESNKIVITQSLSAGVASNEKVNSDSLHGLKTTGIVKNENPYQNEECSSLDSKSGSSRLEN